MQNPVFEALEDDSNVQKRKNIKNKIPNINISELINDVWKYSYKIDILRIAGDIREYYYLYENLELIELYELIMLKLSINYTPITE